MPAIMMADPGSLANMRQFGDHPPPPQFQGFQPGPGQSPGEAPEVAKMRRLQDMENLRNMLIAWNANRLDLFELSMPNEELEFHGVMRFYYQNPDPGSGQKVATKCIRVSSTADANQIIQTLIEKFRPDMKMLEVPEYALYEIHESGERRIGSNEKPLLVQLSWHHDDREGRFLLRRMDEASHMPKPTQEDSSFKRKLSKREKKELKKQEKKEQKVKDGKADESMADKLYTELPDTSFTRSISNPEAVMRRRRQQKLEKKLQQFRSKDGGPDTGGTLKIYGESLRKDVPYKTLLLSVHDTAGKVVAEMLDKYGIDRREAANFCLVQSNLSMPDDGGEGQVLGGGTTREYILDEEECPLHILMNHQAQRGAITFHVKRRPGDGQRRRKKKTGDNIPFLVELTPDGGDRMFRIQPSVTEVGCEVGPGGVQLPGLLPRHCLIAHTEGAVTVTPCSPHAEVVVNNHRANETTILQHGSVVKLGKTVWRFIDPSVELQQRQSVAGQLPVNLGSIHGSTATLPGPGADLMGPAGMRSSTANYVSLAAGGQPQQRGKDAILPAVLEFREETEREFFNALTFGLDPGLVNFKLAPTYTIYMATRFRASTHYRPELVPEERAVRLTDMLNRVSDMVLALIKNSPGSNHAPSLSFWMANASELLHFLKSDRHITAFSLQAQDMLAEAVHEAFKKLVMALQTELEHVLPNFLSEQDTDGDQSTLGIISVFSSAMGLLRKCRVNAALTIQLFSQLFHFVNMWTFNFIISDGQLGLHPVNYCTHTWGLRLKRRLAKVEMWAEKQGLELAADCHLARITQAAHLLQARKSTPEDIATLSSTCFKLNSLQLESLLSRYQPADHEAPISQDLIQTIVRVAQNTVDELTRREQRQVRLEEDFVLQLPFLLPEDNYSCDIIRGVPGGLVEFISPLQRSGLCVMTPQPTSSGFWTIYLDTPPPLDQATRPPSEMSQVTMNNEVTNGHPPPPTNGHNTNGGEPDIQTIRLSKTNGMGLSIVAAKGNRNEKLGIYIKAVVEGGAAWQDGRLRAGDQLLACDGASLVGITQERAAQLMMGTGPVVTLEVAKLGAFYDGLDQLLLQPSPVMAARQDPPRRVSGNNGPPPQLSGNNGPPPQLSGNNGPPPQLSGNNGPPPQLPGRIPQSKSVPALHQTSPGQPEDERRRHTVHQGPGPGASPGGESQHNYQNQEWISQLPPRTGPNLPPGYHPPPPGQSRSASVQNLIRQPPMDGNNPENLQTFYQNLGQPRPRFGSQTSLNNGPPAPVPRDRPMSAIYPPPQVMRYPPPPSSRHMVPPPMSSNGPEKPQRQFSYELDDIRSGMMERKPSQEQGINQRPPGQESGRASVTRVRFQDPQAEDPSLTGLRMSSVETEFRRRVEQYTSDSDDEESKMSTIKRNGALVSEDRKRSDLEERMMEIRKKSETTSPPPLPNSPPPAETPPPPPASSHPAHRLDMLLGNTKPKSETPTKSKKVSFLAEEVSVSKFEYNDEDIDSVVNETTDDDEATDTNDNNLSQQNLEQSPQDPNAFINEAETMLSGVSLTMTKIEPTHVTSTHTPSVIGTQEVYRDPRSRMLMEQQERKLSGPKQTDGSKLSFAEKMKLFAQEAGETTPRDKAKISKAQREIDD